MITKEATGRNTEWTYNSAKEMVWYDPGNIDDINEVRIDGGKKPLSRLDGYCMSTGCSCRYRGSSQKGIHICGLWQQYDESGIKKDFVYHILGI